MDLGVQNIQCDVLYFLKVVQSLDFLEYMPDRAFSKIHK
jgi:hypothetical protein